MTANIAREMRWHKEQLPSDDGESMRHPADAESWKRFDEDYSWFAQNARNVRLGLASDGFNPFNNMAKPYSIWPVILVPYNLPPWLCMKDQFFMTSLIIPGPKSAGNDIDVYLQPLVDELLEFWEQGVPTYDASTKETFMLHAALMWTINDFPAYGILSGWSTKGRLACPACNEGTDANWLKYGRKHCYMGHCRFLPPDHMWRKRKNLFNGKEDHRRPPRVLEGSDIEAQLLMLGDVQFDVMHIEKNIFDNILSTLMNIPGQTKDNINSRRDLEIFGFRKELHLKYDGERVTMPHSMYTLHGEERKKFCEWLADVKFPDGFASNISHCVSVRDCRISGLKSHDCHVFMQRLLPIAVGGFLRPDIGLALTELCTFFKGLYVETKFTRVDRNIDGEAESNDGFKIFNQKVRPIGTAGNRQLSDKLLTEATWYILNNCAEIGPYLEEHYEKCRVHNPNSIDRTHHIEFPTWLKKRVQDQRITNPLDVADDLYALVCGPERWVASYTACIINGKRFHTKQRELRRRTQNSGVLVTGDENTNNVDFYGVINEIVELHYMGWRRVYLFMCDWFDVGDPRRGVRVDNHMTSINMDRTWYKDEPFVLACQASQCFYIKDIRAKGRWFVVQRYTNRNVYDIPSVPRVVEDIDGSTSDDDAYQETKESYDYAPLQCDACPVTTPLNRDDIEPILIEAQEGSSSVGQNLGVEDFIDDDMIDFGSGDASGDGENLDEEDFSTEDESLSD
ncbi:uncharacterized protein LOC122312596 [Carya illinoinensis]|uniref:uncharacterized protein LOC122312596 n=1 Tax=Carya illinoinensis TaxID=32201 RepID=UPI001C72085C|nr:uncharacterized protein LOC122312596 [Carya illinoinensis]